MRSVQSFLTVFITYVIQRVSERTNRHTRCLISDILINTTSV